MCCLRYIVLDDAPDTLPLGLTADQFAEELRLPLAAIGVRVVHQRSCGAHSRATGFQARGCSRAFYFSKLSKVEHVVNTVMTQVKPASKQQRDFV
jgi:hypothetical protein